MASGSALVKCGLICSGNRFSARNLADRQSAYRWWYEWLGKQVSACAPTNIQRTTFNHVSNCASSPRSRHCFSNWKVFPPPQSRSQHFQSRQRDRQRYEYRDRNTQRSKNRSRFRCVIIPVCVTPAKGINTAERRPCNCSQLAAVHVPARLYPAASSYSIKQFHYFSG